jgi:catechol 2,3-dioxygenase-like lactoylglutathione lyase family enzyme
VFRLVSTVLGAPDPRALADWVTLRPEDASAGLSFQLEAHYRPPVWPEQPGEQQMLMHLDLLVPDLAAAVAVAIEAGARLAEFQPQDDVRVLFDPAGHPFCLFER